MSRITFTIDNWAGPLKIEARTDTLEESILTAKLFTAVPRDFMLQAFITVQGTEQQVPDQ